jgi:hypothetical protein
VLLTDNEICQLRKYCFYHPNLFSAFGETEYALSAHVLFQFRRSEKHSLLRAQINVILRPAYDIPALTAFP